MHPGERYATYYERYSALAPLHMAWDAFRAPSRIAGLALVNRQKDYRALAGDARLLALHRDLNSDLVELSYHWSSYDYGEGYFYQGLPELRITGLRDTTARVEAMNLNTLLSGARVLEIGCNTGFLSLAVAGVCQSVTAFDVNPYLIRMARRAGEFLGRMNVSFAAVAFEDLSECGPYDLVLSFANHSTVDHNTRQPLERYFERCRTLLAPGGTLLFESHPPAHEGEGLASVRGLLSDHFHLEEDRVLDYGTFLDRGRTFIRARRRR